jgi:hypothetical protein
MQADSHLAVRMVPAFVVPVEAWVTDAVQRTNVMPAELRQAVTGPLIRQLRNDVRPLVGDLAELRLTADQQQAWSVQTQAKRMGITRARVYQLLEECSRVMNVRWPEGPRLIRDLNLSWQKSDCCPDTLAALQSLREVFFREEPLDTNGRERSDEDC